MTNPENTSQSIIDALEQELANLERQGNAILTTINILRAKAGLPPRPGGWSSTSAEPAHTDLSHKPVAIHSDTFLGKRMGSAAREYLDMRKASGGDPPATVREIFDALKDGGFDFRSKDDRNAMIVLGAMLRKNSATFHKVQKGKYGLRSWYQNPKAPKPGDTESDDEEQDEKPASEDKVVAKNATAA